MDDIKKNAKEAGWRLSKYNLSADIPETDSVAIAEEAGYELTEKELSAICGGQGGDRFCNDDCYFCGTDGWMV
ncbi:MAG: hypothetical protein IKN45_03945 [Lachnospiraceae bacterium]|nr:hypothetical protein [Lachnospiraceae bacterium]